MMKIYCKKCVFVCVTVCVACDKSYVYVCVVLVVSQALLQAHDPDIQAKLLAMQRQMQLSGAAIPADSTTTAVASSRSTLTHDLPASVATIRHNRVMTAEEKEEQTRRDFIMLLSLCSCVCVKSCVAVKNHCTNVYSVRLKSHGFHSEKQDDVNILYLFKFSAR